MEYRRFRQSSLSSITGLLYIRKAFKALKYYALPLYISILDCAPALRRNFISFPFKPPTPTKMAGRRTVRDNLVAVNALLDGEFAKDAHLPLPEDPQLVSPSHRAALEYFEAELEADIKAAEAEAEAEREGPDDDDEDEEEEVERGETRVEKENVSAPARRSIVPLQKSQAVGEPAAPNAHAKELFNPSSLQAPSQQYLSPPQPHPPFTPQPPLQPVPPIPQRNSPFTPQFPSRSVSSISTPRGPSQAKSTTTSKAATNTQKPPPPAQPGRPLSARRSRGQLPKALADEEKPVEASAEVIQIAVSKVRDGSANVLPEEVFTVLRWQVEKWDSGKQGPAWSECVPGFFTTVKCVDRHIASKTSEWERKDGRLYNYWACKLCSSKSRVCVLLETPGTLTILPKSEMDRLPTSGPADNDFWV